MPLTPAEAAFLAAYIDEYMAITVGPAGRKLREQGIRGIDLLYLLDAYWRAHPPRSEGNVVDGHLVKVLVLGQPDLDSPDPPWPTREATLRRNAEMLEEREASECPL